MKQLFLNSPAILLAIVVTALVSLGLVMVYSSSGAKAGQDQRVAAAERADLPVESFTFHHGSSYLKKQLVWTFIGMAALLCLMSVPIDLLEKSAPWLMLLALLLLLAVLVTPFGISAKGARRWLALGPFTIQPSEFAKIALVLFMARFLNDKRDEIRDWKRGFLPTMAIWGIFAVLIILERDLGTIILMGGVMMGMWLLARMKMSHLGWVLACSVPIVVLLILVQPYRLYRILAFLNPDAYRTTYAFQLHQSLIAVGSGGFWGRGLGLGLQKYHFLSEAHTDFIFATVAEEIGLIGAASVVLLFLAFALIGFRVSFRAPDYFGILAAAGLTLTVACAGFINFFVVLGLAPTKGLALPFFTYGGSSMVSSLMAVGILINIANYTARSHGGD